jgi:8-oxo-dGTP pyrophosphatase MutT (NUDIX family)
VPIRSGNGRMAKPYSPLVPYARSYLWRLRQEIGNALVLMPGAMIALQRGDGRVLPTKRADDGSWCLPAGAAEEGGSFARTAVEEAWEETGIRVAEKDLIPFGCLSEAEAHTIRYPSGDVTHCFALCFLARTWDGEPHPDRSESIEVRFAELDAVPEPVHPPTARALGLLTSYLDSGEFQVS